MASNSDSTAVGISAENIPANSEIEMGSTNIVGSQAGASTSAGVLKTMPIILLGVSAVVIVILAIFVGLLAGGVFNNTNTNTNTKVIYRNLTQSPSLSPNQVPSRVPFVSGTVQVTAWASTPTTINPPELSVLGPITSATTGISFSGGGSRAYTCAIGELAALHELGLIDAIDYMTGISGGGWAVSVYSYAQSRVSDTVLLGPVVPPADITYNLLGLMDPNCVRGRTNGNGEAALEADPGPTLYASWLNMISNYYLKPSGIADGTYFSWNNVTAAEVKSKVPPGSTVILPRSSLGLKGVDQRPFPIVGITLVGPRSQVPINPTNRNCSLMEASPIAFGILSPTTTLSFSEDGPAPPTQQYTLGGSIENFAAITCCAANTVINPSAGLNTVTLGIQSSCLCYDEVFDLRVAAGTGSYAVGMSVAGYTDPIQQDATIGTQNFAFPRTVASNSQTSYVVSDGGNMLNDNIVSFLQRKITRILAFVNCEQTLAPPSVWNPNGTVPYQTTFMDKSVAALFNVIGTDTTYSSEISFYTARNHFFPTADFYKLATALQAAQAAGNGIVTTTSHVTVANAFYGIPAGFHVNITWFYLSRATTWESKLSADMQARVVPPAGTPLNVNFPNGTFANFPNYVTAPLSINYTQANLLADFTGWAVLQNADLYRKALLGV